MFLFSVLVFLYAILFTKQISTSRRITLSVTTEFRAGGVHMISARLVMQTPVFQSPVLPGGPGPEPAVVLPRCIDAPNRVPLQGPDSVPGKRLAHSSGRQKIQAL